jgi:RNA polymerase sigma-70 factor (ECF subfamily)
MATEHFTKELLRVRGSLFGFILSIVRQLSLAEDLFQEVCVRMLEREGDFTPGTDFGAWAREFARRTILETRRRRNRIVLSVEAVRAVESRYAKTEEDAPERRAALRICLRALKAKDARLLDLQYEAGMDMNAIGRRLGRTAAAVQVLLSRLRARLLGCIRHRMATGATT